jgi:hypothetical protein
MLATLAFVETREVKSEDWENLSLAAYTRKRKDDLSIFS